MVTLGSVSKNYKLFRFGNRIVQAINKTMAKKIAGVPPGKDKPAKSKLVACDTLRLST